MRLKLFLILCLTYIVTNAQTLTWDPLFATDQDSITIVYDATQGNGALVNVFPVYFHTGVITNLSTAPNDWRYVQTQWGSSNPAYQMEFLGNNKWQLKIPHIRNYYGVPANEQILELAFVFRYSDGSIVGRESDGGDIFLPLSQGGLSAQILSPADEPLFVNIGQQINVLAVAQNASIFSLYLDDSLLTSTTNDSINYTITVSSKGKRRIIAVAEDNQGGYDADSTYFLVHSNPQVVDLPNGIEAGITYISDTSVVLDLVAPNKNFIYVIGDFNNWEVDPLFNMNKTPDGENFWIEIGGLEPGMEYSFQYLVDGQIRIADPYSEKILDPWNDKYIDQETYPDLIPYPTGITNDAVTVIQTAQPDFNWTDAGYQKPENKDLIIYELLIRDFLESHNYQTLIDTLSYLESLGINAIELMPVTEFEGNISWGYNPSFMFAVDKYYGPADEFKRFVNECHNRGIAVIMDLVLNHQFGQSPLVRLYASDHYGPPTEENPWFNVTPRHPFNVGYDMNHESPYTQYFVDRVNKYWVEKFHVDGYRYDLSKGFTQTYSGTNVGMWGQYDASRIAILKRMKDALYAVYPGTYMILEHFADNSEEKVLANYGFMLWGNMNHDYLEAAMGYSSDFGWASYKNRGWSQPNLVAYMESHDEERMMYKNLMWGNSSGGYSVKDLNTALQRVKLAASFFFTIPGPKMIWQFEELGYDVSINYDCRTCPKPIHWDYLNNVSRVNVYKTFKALADLKKYDVFRTDNFTLSTSTFVKRINLYDSSMDAVVVGNFSVNNGSINPKFTKTGYWYDYFSGDSINVVNTTDPIPLQPGEFHIYTSQRLPKPEDGILTSVKSSATDEMPTEYRLNQNYPNPFNPSTIIKFAIPAVDKQNNSSQQLVQLRVYDVLGREVATLVNEYKSPGNYEVEFDASGLSSGIYFYRLTHGEFSAVKKMILIK